MRCSIHITVTGGSRTSIASRAAPRACGHPRALTRTQLAVVCFRGEADRNPTGATNARTAAALSMPTVANSVDVGKVAELAAGDFKYHTSFWHRELVDQKEQVQLGPGVGDYARALHRWRAAYPAVELHQQLVLASGNDVFVFPHFSATNNGEFLGTAASHQKTECAGSYRIHLDGSGKVAGLWEYRSGTLEEAHALLREPEKASELGWLQDFTPYPCSWEVDQGLQQAQLDRVQLWVHDVWMQGNVKAIAAICAPDVVAYDGVGVSIPHCGPIMGAPAVQRVLGGIFERYNPGGMVPLATAVNGNQVALHWTQCLFEKGLGAASRQSGISLFVFDHAAQVVQQLHFSEPLEAARLSLFHETRIVPRSQDTRIVPAQDHGQQGH